MITESTTAQEMKWTCDQCRCALVAGQVTVSYMGHRFTTELPHCPRCGLVMVPESIALGKMAEVEQILEDK